MIPWLQNSQIQSPKCIGYVYMGFMCLHCVDAVNRCVNRHRAKYCEFMCPSGALAYTDENVFRTCRKMCYVHVLSLCVCVCVCTMHASCVYVYPCMPPVCLEHWMPQTICGQ